MTSRDMFGFSEKLLEQEEEQHQRFVFELGSPLSLRQCRKVCATGCHRLKLWYNQAPIGVLQAQYAVCGTDKQKSARLPVGRQLSAVSEATCSHR